jgi:hypothetical protein
MRNSIPVLPTTVFPAEVAVALTVAPEFDQRGVQFVEPELK